MEPADKHPKLAQTIICYFVIAFSILIFVDRGLFRTLDILDSESVRTDFFHWYAAGELWNEGQNLYDYELYRSHYEQLVKGKQLREKSGYYYPPQASMLFGLLTSLPQETAYRSLQGVNLFLLLSSLLMLAYILSWYRPIHLPEITLLTSFIATGYARINMREGQLGLLLAVLVLGAFILARSKREILAGVALGFLIIKPTFFPLYMGYYLLRRSYRLVIVSVLVAGLSKILPVLLTQRPFPGTILAWLQSVSQQNVAGNVDDPSPFLPTSTLMSHLEPLVYRVLNSQSTLATAIVWLIVITLSILVAYLIWRRQPSDPGELLDFSLISALSMIAIYHRPYDAFLLFPGILYIYIHAVNASNKAARLRWGLFIVAIILALIMPVDMPLRIVGRYPDLEDTYLWRVIAPIQSWISLAVFSALLWLKIRQPSLNEQSKHLALDGHDRFGSKLEEGRPS